MLEILAYVFFLLPSILLSILNAVQHNFYLLCRIVTFNQIAIFSVWRLILGWTKSSLKAIEVDETRIWTWPPPPSHQKFYNHNPPPFSSPLAPYLDKFCVTLHFSCVMEEYRGIITRVLTSLATIDLLLVKSVQAFEACFGINFGGFCLKNDYKSNIFPFVQVNRPEKTNQM